MNIAYYIGTAVISVLTWVLANKHIFPWVINLWREKKTNDLNYKSTLQGVEETSYNIYENQLKFMNEQIDSLQSIIKIKSEELQRVYTQLSKLRQNVQQLELELIRSKENETLYQGNCCAKAFECHLRIPCADASKLIADIENEEESTSFSDNNYN